MGRLTYSLSVSMDGFAAAPGGSLDWVDVDEELHSYFNDEARKLSGSLYGRTLVRAHVRLLADGRDGSRSHARGGRVRTDLGRIAEDRLLEHARGGRLEQPARARRRDRGGRPAEGRARVRHGCRRADARRVPPAGRSGRRIRSWCIRSCSGQGCRSSRRSTRPSRRGCSRRARSARGSCSCGTRRCPESSGRDSAGESGVVRGGAG